MWYVNYLLFIGLAVFFLVLAIWREDNPFVNLLGILLSSILWLIISLSQMQLDFTYRFYNETGNFTVTGVHTYTDPISPYLVYFFLGLFILTQIYLWAMVWDKWYNYKNWHGGN